MAEKLFKVVQLDDGSITVDAPASEFPEKGYFTLYDKSASARGECEPMRRQRRDTARVSGRQERPCDPPGVAMMPGALPGGRHVTTTRTNARAPWSRPACSAAAVPAREQPRCTQTSPAACCVQAIGRFSVRSPYALRAAPAAWWQVSRDTRSTSSPRGIPTPRSTFRCALDSCPQILKLCLTQTVT